LRTQLEGIDSESRDLNQRLAVEIAEGEGVRRQLAEEVAKSEALTARIAELERKLVAQTTEAEVLGRRVQELTAQLDERGQSLSEREQAANSLRSEFAIAQKTVLELRAELVEAENRKRAAIEAAETERTAIESQLKQSQAERDKLQNDLTLMRREVDATWATQRVENAVLREHINDIAAEIARLTSAMEGADSPIAKMLAADTHRAAAVAMAQAGNGGADPRPSAAATNGESAANGESATGSLADRMRALQRRAEQVPQPTDA